MKKSIVLFIAITLLANSSRSLAQSFDKGTVAINAGVGFLSSIGYYAGSGVTRTPVISLSGEYCIDKVGPGTVGVGLAFGYQSAAYTYNYGSYYYKDKWTTTLFGLRGTYHPEFLNSEKYDVYGAIQLSFDHFGYSFSTNDPYYNSLLYERNTLSSYVRPYFILGGRYYFTKSIGVFGELGYDISYLKLGLTIKINKSTSEIKK